MNHPTPTDCFADPCRRPATRDAEGILLDGYCHLHRPTVIPGEEMAFWLFFDVPGGYVDDQIDLAWKWLFEALDRLGAMAQPSCGDLSCVNLTCWNGAK